MPFVVGYCTVRLMLVARRDPPELTALTVQVEITERDGSEWVELTTRVDNVKAGRG